MTRILKGLLSSRPADMAGLADAARLFNQRHGVDVVWEELADGRKHSGYDLLLFDHLDLGAMVENGQLEPLDSEDRADAFGAIAAGSVGESVASYHLNSRQWALPVEASCQVQAIREDLVDPIEDWDEILEVAEQGGVMLPLRPPHALATFYTLAANLMEPCATGPAEKLVDSEIGTAVYEMLAELVSYLDPTCFDMGPTNVLEAMAARDSVIACAPFIAADRRFAVEGFRQNALFFTDIPEAGMVGPAGSVLGGIGIGVLASSEQKNLALDFAYFIASGDIQRSTYAAGGQAAHRKAWEDEDVNAACGDFYFNIRPTIEGGWVRPRHNGVRAFEADAGRRLTAGLKAGENAASVLADLDRLYARSFNS